MNKDKILKKYEDNNEYHFHEVDREWILQAMQEYADQQLRLNSVVSSLPNKKEILKQARKEENYIGNESDIIGAEKTGKFHGFLKGVEWLSNRLKYHGNGFKADVICCSSLEELDIRWMYLDDQTKCMPHIKNIQQDKDFRVNFCPVCGKKCS